MANQPYRGRERGNYGRNDRSRQEEQFEADFGWRDAEREQRQMGEGWSRDDDFGSYESSGNYGRGQRDRGGQRGYARGHHEHRGQESEAYASFTGDDQSGRDFSMPRYGYGRGTTAYSSHGRQGEASYGQSPREMYGDRDRGRDRGRHEERGFFERAGDEVASWFGDEEAARRRDMDHRGRGPSGYTRSDDRILEDACDALTDDWAIDARNIQVTVQSGEVTLDGTVESRDQKRRAEDCVEDLSGVRHVQNNLRVDESRSWEESNRGQSGRGQTEIS
jgi:osmotically-inducible protein OsmY